MQRHHKHRGIHLGELNMPPRLRDVSFVDLIIGETYADMKVAPGTGALRVPVPGEYTDEIQEVRTTCIAALDKHQDPEFSINHDGVMYRVTVMTTLDMTDVYFLSAIRAEIRPIDRIPFSVDQLEIILGEHTKGLILICGDMAAGKTSTAASVLKARLERFGSTALAIEDPPETVLHGEHGPGRCIQVPASRRHGSYREQLRRALRTRVSALLIGEIRDEDTAAEAVRQSNAGLYVISTIHSKTVTEAIKRLADYASQGDTPKAAAMLATGLTAVFHQRIERITAPNGQPIGGVRLQLASLLVHGQLEASIRNKIREMKFDALSQEIDAQNKGQVWQS